MKRGIFRGSTPFIMLALLVAVAPTSMAQSRPLVKNLDWNPTSEWEIANLPLREFRPRSTLKVRVSEIASAKFPVIDIHSHFQIRQVDTDEAMALFLRVMNENQIALCVSLDGKLGDAFLDHAAFLKKYSPRFAIFAHLDWRGSGDAHDMTTWAMHRDDFVHLTVEQIRKAHAAGAVGIKFFKEFGLTLRDKEGRLYSINDPRWDPIWEVCGELKMPVIMHTGDPIAFFEPIDKNNERIEELARHPDWSFASEKFPRLDALLQARNEVIKKHPQTIFIGAHVASMAEDLEQVAGWLDTMPNLYVELASRISELGRQPFTARDFLIKYQERVLFGTDGPWPAARLRLYWRFLETRDEYFPYSEKEFPPQGFWQIYGVQLPDETLRKIYHENALRLLPSLQDSFQQSIVELEKAKR